MEKIIIKVCASKDSFGAYSENVDGIYGAGDTVEAAKRDVIEAIGLIRHNLPQAQWPEAIKGEYVIEYEYDTQSFLEYYGSMMSLSGLERITGIHQKQLWSYMHGKSKPRAKQVEKIQSALRNFGRELASMQLL